MATGDDGDRPLKLAVYAMVGLLGVAAVAIYASGGSLAVVILLGFVAGGLITWHDRRSKNPR